MKVSHGVFGFIQGTSIGFVMSFAISFILLLVNMGFAENFIIIWLQSALTGFVVSVPVASLAFPLINKALNRFFYVES